MAIQVGPSKKILSMKLVNVDTGEEVLLFEREGSRCHFRKEIYFDNYIIHLRIDWDDIYNGNPVLDADIYKEEKGKRKKMRNGVWHHTRKDHDSATDSLIYLFEFENLRLPLSAQTSVATGTSLDAILVKAAIDSQ
jgi:hypothetical protein